MNKSLIVGRISQTPKIFDTKNGGKYTRATIAVNRAFSKDETDFINLTIFAKTSEYFEKYVNKGDLLSIEGSIQTSSYKKEDGTITNSWSVVVNQVSHLEPRSIVLERAGKGNENYSSEPKQNNKETNDNPWELDL